MLCCYPSLFFFFFSASQHALQPSISQICHDTMTPWRILNIKPLHLDAGTVLNSRSPRCKGPAYLIKNSFLGKAQGAQTNAHLIVLDCLSLSLCFALCFETGEERHIPFVSKLVKKQRGTKRARLLCWYPCSCKLCEQKLHFAHQKQKHCCCASTSFCHFSLHSSSLDKRD